MVRRVRCPRCSAIVVAEGATATCRACGLSGRVEGPARKTRRERDPWTITIDLRKISPAYWSPGFKAFSVLVILAVVYLAGGVSGVVFERTRSDVADDLGQTAGFLSGTQTDGTQGVTDLPDPPVQPAADPDNVTEPPPAPPTPPPPTPVAAPPMELAGNGPWHSPALELPAGAFRLTMTQYGDGFFAVKVVKPNETKPVASVRVSDAGAFTAMERYAGLAAAGEYEIVVTAGDGVAWEVDVERLVDEPSQGNAFAVSGDGDSGFGPFTLSGDVEVTFTTPSSFSYYVSAYRQDGTMLEDCSFTPGATGGDSGVCTFASPTNVYFDVQIGKSTQGKWTLQSQKL